MRIRETFKITGPTPHPSQAAGPLYECRCTICNCSRFLTITPPHTGVKGDLVEAIYSIIERRALPQSTKDEIGLLLLARDTATRWHKELRAIKCTHFPPPPIPNPPVSSRR